MRGSHEHTSVSTDMASQQTRMNTAEAARLVDIPTKTLLSYAKKGIVPCKVIAHEKRNTYIFNRAQLLEWLQGENKAPGNDEFIMDL